LSVMLLQIVRKSKSSSKLQTSIGKIYLSDC
jgi:hypothetical protein